MLKIDRICSQRIITIALQHQSSALLGLLDANCANFETCADSEALLAALASQPDAIVVHNQDSAARSSVAKLDLPDSQIVIEIREETKGVLGLQATRRGDHREIPMEW